jgi:hypothetical protein
MATDLRFRVDDLQYNDFRKGLPEEHTRNEIPLPGTPLQVQLFMDADVMGDFEVTARGTDPGARSLEAIGSEPQFYIRSPVEEAVRYQDLDSGKPRFEVRFSAPFPWILRGTLFNREIFVAFRRGATLEGLGTLRGDIAWASGLLRAPISGLITSVSEHRFGPRRSNSEAVIGIRPDDSVTPIRKLSLNPPEAQVES